MRKNDVKNIIKKFLIEKQVFNNIKLKKHGDISIYLISHGLGGSMSQYVKSLINYYKKYNTVKLYTNENISTLLENIIVCESDILLNMFENDNSENIIVHINTNPNFSEYNYKNFINLILNKKTCDVLITIHDLFWLCPSIPYLKTTKIKEHLTTRENIDLANLLFARACKIIFPSNFIYNVYCEYFKFPKEKIQIINHPDISIKNELELYPTITNTIKILFLGSVSKIKGIFSVICFLNKFAELNKNFKLELHILGKMYSKLPSDNLFIIKNHGEYKLENVFDDIKLIQPHIALLASKISETWSYNSSLLIATGLPIFYNEISVYKERIENTGRKNIAKYNTFTDSIDCIAEKLKIFIKYLSENNHDDKYEKVNYVVKYPNFYKSLYKNILVKTPRFFNKIDKIVYINLDNRLDRNNEMIEQFSKMNIPNDKIVRFSAIRHSRGEMGCTMSHVGVINMAIKNNWYNVLILEDDFNFISDCDQIDNIFNEFNMLYGDIYDGFQLSRGYAFDAKNDKNNFMKVKQCSTTSGYLLSSKIYERLKNNFEEGLRLFVETNDNGSKYSLDVYWKYVQNTSNWYVHNPFVGYQRVSYSDIIKGYIVYDSVSGVKQEQMYISIKMMGGLGNQMFQVATIYALGFEYGLIPVVKHCLEYNDVTKRKSYFDSMMSKVKNITPHYYDQIEFYNVYEKSFGYNEIKLDNTKSYLLNGYFQSYKYFDKYKTKILELFDLGENEKIINNVYTKIAGCYKTISMHIRRGDYLKFADTHFNLGLDYYKNAINYLNINDNNLILIFSDDINWCKENFNHSNIHYVQGTYDINLSEDVVHMKLMSLCNYNIIANSSFSWWGAWLNKNNDKIVIAPKRWFTQDKMNDETTTLFEPFWILL